MNVITKKANIIWSPQTKQYEFLRRREYEVLYGGAAGGGKSEAAIMFPLMQVHIPHFKALILRKSYPQLTELIDKSRDYYRRAFPSASYNDSKHRWTFPSGATVTFGSMYTKSDRENYRGKQYDVIIFDELTHFSWEEYSFMFSRNRPSGAGTFVCIRATTNPGGVGHGWVKERFLRAPPGQSVIETVSYTDEEGKLCTRTRSRVFIPATVFDNKALLENDPDYAASLAMLPESEKQAQLYGSWDSFDGQVFTEWKNDMSHYDDRLFSHVITPFRIPKFWRIYRGFDFGYTKPFAVGWFAVDCDGRIYHIREYYGSNGTPNTGLRITPGAIAENIRRIEDEDDNLRGRQITGIADPSIFDESRGESVARMMEKSPNFIYFSPGDNTRIAGKMQYHYRLGFDGGGIPMFYVFSTCRNFIRTIPSLVYATDNVEDIDTSQEDHIYDMCRYVFMENPISPRPDILRVPPQNDPLSLYQQS